MSPEDRQILREKILVQLADIAPAATTAATLLRGCQLAGFASLDAAGIAAEIDYLRDKGLLSTSSTSLSAAAQRHKLTAPGREHLEAEGLI